MEHHEVEWDPRGEGVGESSKELLMGTKLQRDDESGKQIQGILC